MTTDAPTNDPAALTTHIETRFHQTHRGQLPDLAALARKVERVHGDQPEAPHGLGALLERLIGELEVHMKKQELILFPAIRRGGMPGIEHPIAVMRADHDDHADGIAQIRAPTNDLTLPEGACRSWTALYDGPATFIADLEAHVRLENEVLFPRFAAAP
ncbi:MAG: hemerythrin domain-containing protein [Gemmobacter sp.]|uniref:hemerythrin domain-containing protein n=1 Tax=Gemmobacter sp. TaxID=1898957 RepID=UPI00391C983E